MQGASLEQKVEAAWVPTVPGSGRCQEAGGGSCELPPGASPTSRERQFHLSLSRLDIGSHALCLSLASCKSAEHQTPTSNDLLSQNLWRVLQDTVAAVWPNQLWGLHPTRPLLTYAGEEVEGGDAGRVSAQRWGSLARSMVGRDPGAPESAPWRVCPGAGRPSP